MLEDSVLPLRRVQSKSSFVAWTNPQVDVSKLQSNSGKMNCERLLSSKASSSAQTRKSEAERIFFLYTKYECVKS